MYRQLRGEELLKDGLNVSDISDSPVLSFGNRALLHWD